jgi:hypothetical protein
MVGKQIICINSSNRAPIEHVPNWIVKDKIYTIRAVQHSLGGNGWGFLLEEISNPRLKTQFGTFEPGYNSIRFVDLLGKPLEISLEKQVETINN